MAVLKRNRVLAILSLWFCTLHVCAQATLGIGDFSIIQGETKEVFVEMTNSVEIRALQLRVEFPEGLSMVSGPKLVTERQGGGIDEFGEWVASSKSLDYNYWDDGSCMITVNSDDGMPFAGSEGGVISLMVKADESTTPRTCTIGLKDIELVLGDGENYVRQEDCSCKVAVLSNVYTLTYLLDGAVYHTDSLKVGTTVESIDSPTKEGHTFSGWTGLPETMPANDVTVTGSFTVNKYLVTFKVDEEVISSDSLEYGANIVAPEAPEKEGHTFNGWGEVAATVPASDLTYEGSYSVNSYLLTYIVDGKEYRSLVYEYGASITPEAFPTKEGYTFSGWTGLPETMPAHDVTVTGSFTVNKYLVTFKVDGEVISSDSLEYGANIVAPEAPIKEGHTFSGWGEVAATVPASDLTYEGSYSVNSYLLTYVVDGEVIQSDSVAYGTAITPIAAPVKEGMTFSGWTGVPETMPARDVTVTGSFVTNGYTLTYIVDGKEYRSLVYEYGASITPEPFPTKEGYTFSGWTGLPETMPANDVTVTGTFTVNKYLVTFKIDGEVISSDSLEYGASIVAPDAPTKEGHTFNSWGEVAATVPASDLTYEGSYSVNSYLLTYVVDGEVVQSDSVAYGTSITPIAAPVKEGMTFSGWTGVPDTMPARDVTVTGSFVTNGYKLTYIVDGKEYRSLVYEYGASITPEAFPTKEGYTFSGWTGLPETMPAHDVTVTGSFTVNKYLVTFKVDGEVISSDSLEYGANIVAPEAPEKEGHTFNGWGEVAATVPAHDLTYEGSYSVNSYLLTYVVDGEVIQSDSVAYGTAITPIAAPVKEGMTFSGWTGVPDTMPARDVTVTGSFVTNGYTLTYIVDGKEYKSLVYEYGASITPEPFPTKEGHTFSGWTGLPETMPANDVTVTGTFTVNKYLVTFKIDGEVISSDSLEYGSSIITPDAPTKEGHTFNGWGEVAATVPAGDLTYEGSYSVNSYLLTYIVDGEVIQSDSVAYGTAITPIAAPVKEGMTFSGWTGVPDTMPARDVTVTGSFVTNGYTLTYIVDGKEYKSLVYEYGACITPEPFPTKEGHTFSGWTGLPETMPANDVTVTGSFTVNKYLVTFKIDGKVISSDSLEYGANIVAPDAPTKEGHTFNGWGEVAATVPASDLTYEGSYSVNSYLLTYIVDGEVIQSDSVAYGTAITPIAAPVKEGMTFSGWTGVPNTMPAKDVTVTGSFVTNGYTLTYIVDGKEYRSLVYEYGASITPEPFPTKEGYTFNGWTGLPDTMPANDVTVTGAFTVNKYLVTFKIDGEVISSDSLEYGASIVAPDAPEKEGHTFNGWGEVAATVPASDLTYEGSYSVNSYLLTYVVDGEVVQSDSVAYGTSITPIAAPVKEGMTFSGWTGVPDTMPAKDVTVTGSFVTNGYTLTYIVDGKEYKSLVYEYGASITPEAFPTKEGYTFSGWTGLPEIMPANDVTVTGSFTVNKYLVTFKIGGEVISSDSLEYGASIVAPDAPTKEGHTFNGWGEVAATVPSSDLTYEGSYSVESYLLTYVVDGEVVQSDSVAYGTAITPISAPVKEGMTFSGWTGVPDTMPAKDVTVTGSFVTNGYKLTYIVDGKEYRSLVYEYGASITPEPFPTKEGHTFSGWTGLPETMPANDVTVTGTFTVNKYLVTFKIDGEVISSDSLEYGSSIVAPDAPTKEGHTFNGWGEVAETVPASDLTYEGSYSVNSYLLTYIVDGEVVQSDSVAYGTSITPIAAPVKEGMTFSGWTGVPDTMPARDVTVTGSFVTNGYTLTYIVDGKEYKSLVYEYGACITPEPFPTKEGHTFSGWTGLPETMPANDVTVTGTFTVNKYLVTFKIDGEVISSDSLEYGSSIITPEAPTKEGHTFNGWGEVAATVPASDLTYEGSYSVNSYLLTYVVDGEVVQSDSVAYGTSITPIAAPVKEGHTFSGWTGQPETMPAKDVTVSGEFILNSTQTDAQGLVYELNDEGNAFSVAEYTDLLVNELTIPSELYGLPVASIKAKAFMGADELQSIVIPSCVTTVGDRAFYGCENLLVVEWNTTAPLRAECFDKVDDHGNMLVFVSDASTEVSYKGNVIVDGVAEEIMLTDGRPLRNPRGFVARSVRYTREFTKKTSIGVSGGWEAMVLPFDVQTVTSAKGELKPFGEADFTTSLPCWIATMQADGTFADADGIKANVPFIMEVPNSDEYEEEYNIEGEVSFSAADVTVYATVGTGSGSGDGGYQLLGSYEGEASASGVYALNDEEYTVDGVTSLPGGVFVADSRDIRPFEAYVYSAAPGRAPCLRIGGGNGTGIGYAALSTENDVWYTLQGVRLDGKPYQRGIYIHNRRVVVVE